MSPEKRKRRCALWTSPTMRSQSATTRSQRWERVKSLTSRRWCLNLHIGVNECTHVTGEQGGGGQQMKNEDKGIADEQIYKIFSSNLFLCSTSLYFEHQLAICLIWVMKGRQMHVCVWGRWWALAQVIGHLYACVRVCVCSSIRERRS